MTDAGIGNLDGLSEIDKLMTIIEFYFPGKSDAVRVLLGAVASLSVIGSRKTIPLWLCGEPGASKTSALNIVGGGLNLFDFANIDTEFALFIEQFSAKSFRSVHNRDDSIDLLDRLREGGPRVLITTELNILWTKPQQQLDELCGVITKICDDDPSISYASAGRISGSHLTTANNFIWLAATITLPDKVSKRFSNSLGPRLYFFNMKEPAQTAAEISASLSHMESDMRDYSDAVMICQRAVAAFLQAVNITPNSVVWNKSEDEGTPILSDVATILRVLRAGLEEKKKKNKIRFRKATLEAPARCRKIITQFARGDAVLCQSNSIGMINIPLVIKTIFDTAEVSYPERTQIFYRLLQNNGHIALEELAHQLKSTVEFILETVNQLEFLGLVQLQGNIVTFTAEYAEISMGLQPHLFPEMIQTEVDSHEL